MNFPFQILLKRIAPATAVAVFIATASSTRADIIELTNGDHYRGTVMGMTLTNIDFLSEIQGRVKLPRDKVAQITLHDVVPRPVVTNAYTAPPSPTNALTNPDNPALTAAPVSGDDVIQQLRTQGVDPKLIVQVQEQIFGKASPEAAQKFNQLVNGLTSGSISLKDIRAQAQDSINQIRAAKKELGPDAGDMLDSYLGILEKFVADSAAEATPPAKPPIAKVK